MGKHHRTRHSKKNNIQHRTKISGKINQPHFNMKSSAIELTPSGFKFLGLKINIKDFPYIIQSKIRWMVSLYCLSYLEGAAGKLQYFFLSPGNSSYEITNNCVDELFKLVSSKLQQGQCSATELSTAFTNTAIIKDNFAYCPDYQYSGLPVVEFFRNAMSAADETFEACIINLIEEAIKESNTERLQPIGGVAGFIGIILGIFICFGCTCTLIELRKNVIDGTKNVITSCFNFFYNKCNKEANPDSKENLEKTPLLSA